VGLIEASLYCGAASQHELRWPQRGSERNHREERGRIVLGDDDVNVLQANDLTAEPIEAYLLRTGAAL
jgi:hypothetical protein